MELRSLLVAGLAAASLLVPFGGAMAQTISHTAPGTMTALEMDGSVYRVGQIVEVPAGYDRLKSFSFWIEPGIGGVTVTPTVRSYHATSDRYANTVIATAGAIPITGVAQKVTFTFDAPVVAGQTYMLSLDIADDMGVSAVGSGQVEVVDGGTYAGGNWLEVHFNAPANHSNKDARFEAVFGSSVSAVPTIGEWAMILMALGLAGGAATVVMRRRAAA